MTRSKKSRLVGSLREVGVIVVGVSVALAGDAAYGQYHERQERERILRSFRADLQLDSAQFAAAVGSSSDALARLVDVLEAPSPEVSAIELAAAIRESIFFPSGLKEDATYREATSGAGLSLIQERTLRESLLRYYSRSFTGMPSEMWVAYLTDVHGAYERTLRRHLGSAYLELVQCQRQSPEFETCLAGPSLRVDLAALRADPDFAEGVVAMSLWSRRFRNLIGVQQELHRSLTSQLDDVMEGG